MRWRVVPLVLAVIVVLGVGGSAGAESPDPGAAATSPAEIWDLGHQVTTRHGEVRIDLEAPTGVTGLRLDWSEPAPRQLDVAVSADAADTDRTIVARQVPIEPGPSFEMAFEDTVVARHLVVVLGEGRAAELIDRIVVRTQPHDPETVLDATFEQQAPGDRPDGWVVTGPEGSATVESAPDGSGQALRVANTTSQSVQVRATVPPVADDLVLRYRAWAEQTNDIQGIRLAQADGRILVGVDMFEDARWRITDGAGHRQLGGYEPARWYDVELRLRLSAGTYDLIVGGVELASEVALDVSPGNPGVTSVYVNAWSRTRGIVHFDDVGLCAVPDASRTFEVPDADGPEYPLLGVAAPRSAATARSADWSIDLGPVDRGWVDHAEVSPFLGPLGVAGVHLVAGWARTEPVAGTYDWTWLDQVMTDLERRGLRPWVSLGYGNPAYPGGGGADPASGLPTSAEALRAWDQWVDAVVARYGHLVEDWAVWDQADLYADPAAYAEFLVRTARVVRDRQPEATIIAVGGSDAVLLTTYVDEVLEHVDRSGDIGLIDEIAYHPYSANPDSSYELVAALRDRVTRRGSHITVRQAGNGAPSAQVQDFELRNRPWTELTQAKWNIRRMLGDRARAIPSTIVVLSDAPRDGRWDPRGLLFADPDDPGVRQPKQSYHAVQAVAALFSDEWTVPDDAEIDVAASRPVSQWVFRRPDGRLFAIAWWRDRMPADSIRTELSAWTITGAGLDDPVLVDLRTGRVYEPPDGAASVDAAGVTVTAPLYDSPVAILDRSVAIELMSPCRGTVVIGDQDSGVADRLVDAADSSHVSDACLSELIGQPWDHPSKAEFLRHVGDLTSRLVQAGVLDLRERSRLMQAAARLAP